jgi:hypothetical protein
MESVSLQDFVAETLKAISLGVAEAQDASRSSGGIPIGLHSVGSDPVLHGEQLVKFIVSLQAEHASSKRAGAEAGAAFISVITGKLDVSAQSGVIRQHTHTVEFSVPVHFNSRWPKEGA